MTIIVCIFRMFNKNKMIFIFCLFWGDHTRESQGLLLALYSGVIPGNVWGNIWDAGDGNPVSYIPGKCRPIKYQSGKLNDLKI